MTKQTELAPEHALVLYQIEEADREDFDNLSESLAIDRNRLRHIIASLRNKGLINIARDNQRNLWIQMTTKGQRLVTYLKPDMGLSPGFAT